MMFFGIQAAKHSLYPDTRELRPHPGLWLIAAAVCLTVIIAGTLLINLQARENEARRKIDLLIQGSSIRARLSRELNRVLYLTSGLSSYLTVRHTDLHRNELESILLTMYQNSQHVMSFGIAVGYRVTYVYPVKGNASVIGIYYPDVPSQWPAIKRTIDNRQAGAGRSGRTRARWQRAHLPGADFY